MTDTNRQSNAAPKPSSLGPHSIEAEEAILGAMLINAEGLANIADFLKPDDFFELKHQWVWEGMIALQQRGEVVDYLTVTAELRSKDKLDQIGGASFLTYLLNSTPTHLYAEAYARLVERAAIRRRLVGAAGEIANLARDDSAELQDVIAKAETALFRVTDDRLRKEMVPMSQAVSEYFERIEYLYNTPDAQLGVPCGFTDVDRMLGGLQKSDLLVVAARPGVGKTSFLLSIALNVARRAHVPVAIFTLEMGREQLLQRFYSIETGINSQRMRIGNLEPHEWDRFMEATSRLDGLPMFIDDTPGISIQQMRARCRRLHRENGLGLIIVDYLQLMSAGGAAGREQNRVLEVGALSRGLKEMARELNVPVVTASQLSRSVEQRSDKRPQLSDLRESGSIEQDSDIVMFLYRDELYNENTDRPNQADVIVAKHRNGPTGTVSLFFRKELTQFVDMVKQNTNLSDY
ncbi:MAG TPA: replicative DNA helicase [Aggregatilineales bacterium]|nr:replicative DNA helicase [Anaerolineales bacterium]HRE48142.1 replicative DNA helicase [Aggregatilineales bacterium]